MAQTIEILRDTPARILLFNAMSEVTKHNNFDFLEMFKIEGGGGYETTVQIDVHVNGVAVPFLEVMEPAFAELFAQFEAAVQEKAVKLITESRLNELYTEIANAEWRIQDALDNLNKDNP